MSSISIQLLDGQPVDGSQYAHPGVDLSAASAAAWCDAHRASLPAFTTWCQAATPDLLFGQMGLTDHLQPTGALRVSAHETWQTLFQTASFQTVCAPLLQAMGWYGAGAGEQASPRITQALAGRAIVEHFLGAMQGTWQPMDRLLRRQWLYHYSHSTLRQLIGELIAARHTQSSPAVLEMLGYLLLRDSLPELLVEGVPEHLCYGRSLQSIALIHSVALLEALSPGLAPAVAFDELVRLSAALAQSHDPRLHALWVRTQVTGALHYGLAHGLITAPDDDISRVGPAEVGMALQRLQADQDAHAAELQALLRLKPADRRRLAQAMLRASNVPHWLWSQGVRVDHWPVLQEHGLSIAADYSLDRLLAVGRPEATVEELVMMGEAWMIGQAPVPQAYATDFETFAQALVEATARLINRLLLEMLAEDRQALLQGTLELSRVSFAGQQGSQGLFIRCQPGDHREDFHLHSDEAHEVCFELFPAAGVIRRVTQRFDYHVEIDHGVRGDIAGTVIREQENAERVRKALNTPLLPMDSDAYLTGSVSRSMTGLHTPHAGELLPAAELFYRAQTPQQTAIEALAKAAAQHLLAGFLASSREAHLHLTAWEQIWAREREWADTAARWIIPFYGCVRDLAAGDRSPGTLVGCVMDGASALLPLGLFASSTARIALHAGEMSVTSLARLTGAAAARLITGLAEQSAVFMVHDVGRLAVTLGRSAVSGLFVELPTLERLLTSAEARSRHSGAVATVDGVAGVPVGNVAATSGADYRLFDPASQRPWGKPLTAVSRAGAMEFSSLSLAEAITPGSYPAVLPVWAGENGMLQLAIDQGCHVRVIERQAGTLDVLVDREVYHLDIHEPNPALRKAALLKLDVEASHLEALPGTCRVRRDLIPVACTQGVTLATAEPQLSATQALAGDHYSHAVAALRFELATVSVGPQPLHVFVYENRLCAWEMTVAPGASHATQAVAGDVVEVSEVDKLVYSLPLELEYRQQVSGEQLQEPGFGLSAQAVGVDLDLFAYQDPVIRLGSIAEGIDDLRTLRGSRIRSEENGLEWIYIEPDRNIFYRAPAPSDALQPLQFERVLPESPGMEEYLRYAEGYRQVRELSTTWQDRENIARLMFDMPEHHAPDTVPAGIQTFDQYSKWRKDASAPNEFHHYAENILTGKRFQDVYIALAKETVEDFKALSLRGPEEVEPILDVLNNLLPSNFAPAGWRALDPVNILRPRTIRDIRNQLKGANLAFASVEISGLRSHVYFAVSGGHSGNRVILRAEDLGHTRFGGIEYHNARPSPSDPRFTTYPAVRHPGRLDVAQINRSLDSERLIGTMLKDELEQQAGSVTRIDFFTLLDACRSCGGFALPRLKRDFPQAQFSVTFLKPYKDD